MVYPNWKGIIMKRFCIISFCVACWLIAGTSCLSPHDPSSYSDEDNLIHDSEKTDEFVKKHQHEDSAQKDVSASTLPKFEARVFTVESPELGYGYKILEDGVPKFSQNTIPSIPGNKAFTTPEKAMKTAEFVIYKLRSGEFPPTVNKAELDSLGVLD